MLGRCDNRYTTETLLVNTTAQAVLVPTNTGYPLRFNVLSESNLPSIASRDRLVVRTLRCGRSNPGSNPGHGSDILLGAF